MRMRTPKTAALALSLALAGVSLSTILAPPAIAAKGNLTENDAQLSKAKDALASGKAREAAIILKNLLRENPDFAPARLMLGKLALVDGDLETAHKEISRSAKLAPSDETAVLLGEIALQRGKPEQALQAVDGDALTKDMTIQKLTIAGAALLELNRLDEAEARHRRVLELDPNRVEGHFGLARVLVAREDYPAAVDTIDAIVRGKPDYAPGWILRGEVSLITGERHAAFLSFDKAVNLQPGQIGPLVSRARAQLSAGNLEGARKDANKVMAISSDAPIAHYLKAAIAYAEGDYDAANNSFTQLQRSFDRFSPAVLLGALIKTQRDQLSQADSLFLRFIAMEPNNLDAQRALAKVRLRMGQPSNAADILKKLLTNTPDDLDTHRTLASAYLAMDDYGKARQHFELVAQNGSGGDAQSARNALLLLNEIPSDAQSDFADSTARIALLKASDMLANGNASGAEDTLDALEGDAANTASVLALRGGIAASRDKPDVAKDFLNKALTINPELFAAHAAYDALDSTPEEAIVRLKTLLQMSPNSEILSIRLASKLRDLGQLSEAASLLRKQSRANPNSIFLAQATIRASMRLDDTASAAQDALRLASIKEASVGDLAFAASALMDANATAEAVDVAKRLIQAEPDSDRATIVYAEALAAADRTDEAYAVLKQYMQRSPENIAIAGTLATLAIERRDSETAQLAANSLSRHNPAAAARLLAHSATELGQPDVAVQVLERAFAQSPNSRLATALFSARRGAGRDEAAFDGLKNWLRNNPRDPAALMTFATGLMQAGQEAEAQTAYASFLRMEPTNPVALNNYAWLRHRAGRPDALDYAERAYRAAPQSPEIADTYGWMMVEFGKLKLGLALLEQAAKKAPNNPEIGYHYAAALSKAGRKNEARTVLTGVLDENGEFEKRGDAQALLTTLR